MRTLSGKRVYFVDIITLFEGEWLNDVVIWEILKLFEAIAAEFYVKDTFFLNKLYTEDYFTVIMGWTAGNIFQLYTRIIIPEFNGNHFTVLVVLLDERRIERHDSMGGKSTRAMKAVFLWLCLENIFKNDGEFDMNPTSWTLVNAKTPLQRNSDDCGAIALMHAAVAMRIAKEGQRLLEHHEITQDRIPARRLWFMEIFCTGRLVEFTQNRYQPQGE